MSSSLKWKPVLPDNGEELPVALKITLREYCELPVVVSEHGPYYEFFRGLAAAHVEGALEVLEAVKKYGKVEIYESW
jgi:hypothetical protein